MIKQVWNFSKADFDGLVAKQKLILEPGFYNGLFCLQGQATGGSGDVETSVTLASVWCPLVATILLPSDGVEKDLVYMDLLTEPMAILQPETQLVFTLANSYSGDFGFTIALATAKL